MKTIKINPFDTVDIGHARNEILLYKIGLIARERRFREKFAERVRAYATEGYGNSISSDTINRPIESPNVRVTVEPHGENGNVVVADGSEAVFIEFGAGVSHNGGVGSTANEWASGKGHPVFSIGSYGEGNGKKKVWGYYEGGQKDPLNVVLTRGTPATSPLYNAALKALQDLPDIVKEVFG